MEMEVEAGEDVVLAIPATRVIAAAGVEAEVVGTGGGDESVIRINCQEPRRHAGRSTWES